MLDNHSVTPKARPYYVEIRRVITVRTYGNRQIGLDAMKTPYELFAELNRTDESERIEAKDSRTGQVGKSVYHTLSAFSNEPGLDGGFLLFGVERDDDGAYRPVGVAEPDKLQSDLASMCAEFNVPIRPRILVENVEGKRLVSAFIPESDSSAKPIYRRAAGLKNGAFRRNGPSDVRCTERDLQFFFADRDGSEYDLALPQVRVSVDDLDHEAIEFYRRKIEARKSAAHITEWSDEELLVGRNCLIERDGEFVPTIAGLVLFGKTASLRRAMPMASRIDYIRIRGRDWRSSAEEMEPTTHWGPLVTLIPRIIDTIIAELPRRFQFPEHQVERIEKLAIPPLALREALVNLDYS